MHAEEGHVGPGTSLLTSMAEDILISSRRVKAPSHWQNEWCQGKGWLRRLAQAAAAWRKAVRESSQPPASATDAHPPQPSRPRCPHPVPWMLGLCC